MRRFRDLLKEKEFIYAVEVEPPRDADVDPIIVGIKNIEADIFCVVDSHLGMSMMKPIPLCHIVQREHNIDTIMHFCCRDRNSIAIEGDLLGAHALGIRNVLCLTGDAIPKDVEAKPVFELNSIKLLKFIKKLNREKGTDFFLGAGANPNQEDLDAEIRKTNQKIEAGAEFIITQPCYDLTRVQKFINSIDKPVIVGYMPMLIRKYAEKFNKLVPGVEIPLEIYEDGRDLTKHYDKLLQDTKTIGAKGVDIMYFTNFRLTKSIIERARLQDERT